MLRINWRKNWLCILKYNLIAENILLRRPRLKLRKQISQKRREIKGKVIRCNSKDKVGNAFGFRANIVLIPISTKSQAQKGLGSYIPAKRNSAKEASGRERRVASWIEASNQGDIIFSLRPPVFYYEGKRIIRLCNSGDRARPCFVVFSSSIIRNWRARWNPRRHARTSSRGVRRSLAFPRIYRQIQRRNDESSPTCKMLKRENYYLAVDYTK